MWPQAEGGSPALRSALARPHGERCSGGAKRGRTPAEAAGEGCQDDEGSGASLLEKRRDLISRYRY